jgi:methylglyoxal synthase
MKRMRVALIAHDVKKDDLIAFVSRHGDFLAGCDLVATSTTGTRLGETFDLSVARVLSGPLGGDLQIAAQLAAGSISVVFFLRDPLTPMAHEADIMALLRLCDVYNVPCATNLASAELVMKSLKDGSVRHGRRSSLRDGSLLRRSDVGRLMEKKVSSKDCERALDVLDQSI